jgi:hypothetical protein
MMARWIVFVLLSFAACASASVTAAWKIPGGDFAPGNPRNEALPRLQEAPGRSAFLKPEDVLFDLSGLVSKRSGEITLSEKANEVIPPAVVSPWRGDWVVWNQSRGQVVASGSYNDLFLVEAAMGVAKMPIGIRTTVELVSAKAGEGKTVVLKGSSGEEATMELQKFEARVTGEDWSFRRVLDALLSVEWTSTGGSHWNVSTAATLPEGARTLMAAHGSGEDRWQIFATAIAEYANGVAVSESRWLEQDGEAQTWRRIAENENEIRGRMGEGLHVCMYRLPGLWKDLRDGPEPLGALPSIESPPALAGWMRGQVADLSGILFADSAGKAPAWFAGFDSRNGRLLVVADAETQDHCEARLKSGIVDPLVGPNLWIESDPGSGGWLLICRAGEKARIYGPGEETSPSFEVAPSTLGGRLFELGVTIDADPENGAFRTITSSGEFKLDTQDSVGRFEVDSGKSGIKIAFTVRQAQP